MADMKANLKPIKYQEKIDQLHSDGPVSEQAQTSHNPRVKLVREFLRVLPYEKKEIKLREQEELLNKVDKISLSIKKGKTKKTSSEEIYEEFEKKLEDLSSFKDEVVKPSKKRKVTIKKKVLGNNSSKGEKKRKRDVLGMKQFKKKKKRSKKVRYRSPFPQM
ncbi:protein MNN4-like [Cucumis melo var. makuwa]|uniref:Protein MNN4-like n=1 Tax=Cucumis melo var. makuwa TaxID=1194695 RepID=A0A5A7V5R2_CUCMM|nr:protein MNN4-like [Cucumis melo var. makuwa]